jgi:hypothetical protein
MISSNSKKYINRKKLILLEKYDKLFEEYTKSCKKISKKILEHRSIYIDVYNRHMKKLLLLLHFLHQIYRITFKKNMPQINMFDVQSIEKHNAETEKYIYIDAFGTPIDRRSNTSFINAEYLLPISNNNYGDEDTKFVIRFSDSKTLSQRYSLDDKQSGGKYTKFNEKLLYSTIIHRCIRLSFVGNKILFNDEPERKYSEETLDNLEYIKYMSILPYYISLKERCEDTIPLFANIDSIDKNRLKHVNDINNIEDILRKINVLHKYLYLQEKYTISYNNIKYKKEFNNIKGYSDEDTIKTILYTIINNNNVISKDYYYWFQYNSPLPATTILDTETFVYGIHTFQPLKLTETRLSDIMINYIGSIYPYSKIVNSSLQNYIVNGIVMEKRAYKRVRNLLKFYNESEYNIQSNKKTIYVFHGTYRDFTSDYNKDVVLTSFLSCTFDINVALKYAYENVKNSGVIYILEIKDDIKYVNFNDEYYQIILAPGLKITITNILVIGSVKYNFCKVYNTDKEYVDILYNNIFEGGNGRLKLYNIKKYKIYSDKEKYPQTLNIAQNSISDSKNTYICLGNQINEDISNNTYFNIKYTLHQHFICDCYKFFEMNDREGFFNINVVNYAIYYDTDKFYTGYKNDDQYENINIESNDYKRFPYNFENLFIDSLLYNEDALYPLNYMKNKKRRHDYKLNSFRGAGLFDTDGFKKINFNIHEPSKVYMELIKEYISRNEDRNSLFIKDITRDYMKIIIEKNIEHLKDFRDTFIDMLKSEYINFIDINMIIDKTTEEYKDLIEMFNELVGSLKITIDYYVENMENGNIYNEIEQKIYERKMGGKMNTTTIKYSKPRKTIITEKVSMQSYKLTHYASYDNKGYVISYEDYVKLHRPKRKMRQD